MDITYFARGFAIGVAIAAPVGPIGLLCIRRTLANGRLAGFVSGMGAATADACYGAVGSLAGAFGSTPVLTLTNPTTILSFTAVFAGLGLGVLSLLSLAR
jgi:threonine/homoserine/homoserine lactone efflux protein